MENWNQFRLQNSNLIYKRQFLYWAFMSVTLAIIIISLCKWSEYPWLDAKAMEAWSKESCLHWVLAHLADIMRYVLPDMFNGFIDFVVLKHPEYLLILGVIVLFFVFTRKKLVNGQAIVRRQMRKLVVKQWLQLKEEGQVKG